MINKIRIFTSVLAILFLAGCQKIDRPEVGNFDTDDNQVLLPGNLRFYAGFNKTDGSSPRWNATDSISGNPAMLFPLTYEAGINGRAMKGKDNAGVLYLNANDFKTATSFTISMWLKNTAQAGRTEFLFSLVQPSFSWHNSAAFVLVEHQTATSATMKFGLMDQWLEGTFPRPLFDGNWHHLVYVYDEASSKMKYYFDGAEVTGLSAAQTDVKNGANPRGAVNFSTTTNLILGGWNRHGNQAGPTDDWVKSYTGLMDQFRMYNKALTAAEVQNLYTNKL